MTGVTGGVMDGKTEAGVKDGLTAGQTELRGMDEDEGVQMKRLIKANTFNIRQKTSLIL